MSGPDGVRDVGGVYDVLSARRYRAYPEYKDSGVEWLGGIPEHWELIPLKHQSRFVNGMAFNPDNWTSEGVPIIRIENLNGSENFNCFIGQVNPRYHVKKGDLLFGWSGNRGTSFGPFLWWRDGIHYLNQHIFKLEDYRGDKHWFYWTLKAVTACIEEEAHGIIGMVHVTKGRLGAFKIPIPSKKEQLAIGSFLDEQTKKIDNLIAAKRELLALLKEKRQAVITHAVTKGLDTNVKFKPSGIDWLGDVPEHWNTISFRRIIARFEQGWSPVASNYPAIEGEVGVLKLNAVHKGKFCPKENKALEEISNKPSVITPAAGDLLISRSNTPQLVGDACVVKSDYSQLIISDLIYRLSLIGESDSRFVCWFLLSSCGRAQIESDARGSSGSMVKLGQNHVRGWMIPLPPKTEQITISEHLDAKTEKIDNLSAEIETAVTKLQEYRTALISAAVTGKIDVRGYAP